MIRFSKLPNIVGGKTLQFSTDWEIVNLLIDSRKATSAEGALFFAISGTRHDGHRYINEMYRAGVRQFVVERDIDISGVPGTNVLRVTNTIDALQSLVIHHRSRFSIPVIGITGSNGKTIVKEWLYQLLSPEFNIVKNPGSYNSQVGVPLSVWQMRHEHTLALFEAGISRPGEMARLEGVIQPTLGLITNLGSAHDEGFGSREEKLAEKLKLFTNTSQVLYHNDWSETSNTIRKKLGARALGWGKGADIELTYEGNAFVIGGTSSFSIDFPFSDFASVENAGHCIAVMMHLNYTPEVIRNRIIQLRTVPMRLELKQGINHCQLIDDTYNNDLAGLQISLNFLGGLPKKKKTIILSDILQSGMSDQLLSATIADRLAKARIDKVIGVGPVLSEHRSLFNVGESMFFKSTEELLNRIEWDRFSDEAILVKGARVFEFERIVQHLQRKIHGTVMEIDLGALISNLNYIRSTLHPGVKLMVMVKAFAYGSGSEEVASLLEYHKVDYLGVAYADEGVELRKNGIRLPIMVMNPSEESFDTLLEFNLEPEIYSLNVLRSLITRVGTRSIRIHVKVDTGMRRLGFEEKDFPELLKLLQTNKNIEVVSMFSHLAGADDPQHDSFSQEQYSQFTREATKFSRELGIKPILHILNSPGILRFPAMQLNMVRLGIGLYGIDPTGRKEQRLKPAATLKTIVSQIKEIKAGETVGYGRSGTASNAMTIATIAIGYADGFSRAFSRGVGTVLVQGQRAKVIGNVCMDMTMVDVTGLGVSEGDEVIVFGPGLPIEQVAASINTIPYEILTNTSERVKRVFYAESI